MPSLHSEYFTYSWRCVGPMHWCSTLTTYKKCGFYLRNQTVQVSKPLSSLLFLVLFPGALASVFRFPIRWSKLWSRFSDRVNIIITLSKDKYIHLLKKERGDCFLFDNDWRLDNQRKINFRIILTRTNSSSCFSLDFFFQRSYWQQARKHHSRRIQSCPSRPSQTKVLVSFIVLHSIQEGFFDVGEQSTGVFNWIGKG